MSSVLAFTLVLTVVFIPLCLFSISKGFKLPNESQRLAQGLGRYKVGPAIGAVYTGTSISRSTIESRTSDLRAQVWQIFARCFSVTHEAKQSSTTAAMKKGR